MYSIPQCRDFTDLLLADKGIEFDRKLFRLPGPVQLCD